MNEIMTPPTENIKKSSYLIFTALILALLALISVIILTVFNFYSWNKMNSLKQQLSETQTSMSASVVNNLQNFQNQLNNLKKQAEKSNFTVSSKLVSAILASTFLQLADTQLAVNKDIPSAIQLMSSAKQKILQTNNSTTNLLLNSIATDLRNLESLQQHNITANILALDEFNKKIQNFSFTPGPIKNTTSQKTLESNHSPKITETWYKQGWDNLKALFNKLVIVEYNPNTLSSRSTFTTQDGNNLKQLILMKINFAEWAILKQNQSLYILSMNQISDWIQKFFPEGSSKQILIADLKPLLAVQLETSLPRITGTLQLMDQLLINLSDSANNQTPTQDATEHAEPANVQPPQQSSKNNAHETVTRTPNIKATGIYI